VIVLVTGRIRDLGQRFARLAARLGAGTYKPRRHHGRNSGDPRPRRRNPLPHQFGWLLPLVPEAVAYRSQLEFLLRDPAMLALIAAAPAPMARVLRPLCWMLRLTPPPILAPPRPATAPPRPATPPRAVPLSLAPNPRPAPPAQQARPAPPASPVGRACGPPCPA